jgi:hypothetical protein
LRKSGLALTKNAVREAIFLHSAPAGRYCGRNARETLNYVNPRTRQVRICAMFVTIFPQLSQNLFPIYNRVFMLHHL